MKRRPEITHRFVKNIPSDLEDGVLYVSIEYSTAIHKCCCGCAHEVVTPISRTDWKLTFDGESISLYPSIGNWNFECRSHYWIKRNQIKWAEPMSQRDIDTGREIDRLAKQMHLDDLHRAGNAYRPKDIRLKKNIFQRLKAWLF